jgi:hypothetical protein
MTSHTHTQRPLVSDINSEAWRLVLTARAAQELREAALQDAAKVLQEARRLSRSTPTRARY